MTAMALRSKRLDLPDDVEAVYAHFEAQGFGDGHPVIPPSWPAVCPSTWTW